MQNITTQGTTHTAMASIPLLRLSLLPPSPSLSSRKIPSSIPSLHRLLPRRPPPTSVVSASYNPTPATDRLISAAAYSLPFINGIQYGRFLFSQYPSLSSLFSPIIPILSLYRSVPYASFVVFFALYLAVVRNPSLSHFVRFNAMQALMLDVALVLPQLVQRILGPGRTGLMFKLMVMGHNAIFVFVVMCFVYSLVCSVLGRTPYLPFVAEAAGRQL